MGQRCSIAAPCLETNHKQQRSDAAEAIQDRSLRPLTVDHEGRAVVAVELAVLEGDGQVPAPGIDREAAAIVVVASAAAVVIAVVVVVEASVVVAVVVVAVVIAVTEEQNT